MADKPSFQKWHDNCTIAGATGSASDDGCSLIGGTSDDPFTTRTRLVVVVPQEGYKFIGTQIISGDTGNIPDFSNMHTRGLNDKGFAYTWSAARPDPDIEPLSSQAIGVPYYQFGQLLLSQAKSVADAIGLLESYPRAIHGNFLFADAAGEIALAEVSTRSLNIETRTSDGWIGRSNHWVSPRMTQIAQAPNTGDSTMVRFDRISALMDEGAGRVDPAFLASCFSDHATLEETGWSICAHGHKKYPGSNGRGGTVSSEIIQPSKGVMHYCYGWPCGGSVDYPDEQVYQDRSWGQYLSFRLEDLEPGEYVTVDGRLTPLAVRYLAQGNGVLPHNDGRG
ncbi:MAG: hypothetical protein IIB15_08710 [Chloroflexi bacterium]|nr:hypothetical protein [Chloroflexota bacterium]